MRFRFRLICWSLLLSAVIYAQNSKPYTDIAQKIIRTALQQRNAYTMLHRLTKEVGPRLSGSPHAAAAVEWARQTMEQLGLQNIQLQKVMVPHWVRGNVEEASIINSSIVGTVPLTVCALGGSVGTPELGVVGEVIEVHNFDEVQSLGETARGKIIFYNRPLDPTLMNTFQAYGGAVEQRTRGAIEAAKVGAVAVLVRSMTTRLDDVPHTGAMRYAKDVAKIPAAAISTEDANFLSQLLKREKNVQVRLTLSCKTLPEVPSANVIGEIPGSEKPDEVILLGAHLDSWDKGEGAHDDGAGCVQVLEALRLIKELDLHPKRTIRVVLFMNEENGLRGAQKYAEMVKQNGPKHIVAIESDRGGFAPRGFSIRAKGKDFERLARWSYLFESMDASKFTPGFGGADISRLAPTGTINIGLMVDSHRYFDYHHSDNDTFDKVNERELELGAAAMAILSYVLAMEGI
ncbi:MAG: peptidase M28 family protein [Calditrichaeota bacterium]|nr:MAG: peptidase M28 family protein [Calditrichota bacterium]